MADVPVDPYEEKVRVFHTAFGLPMNKPMEESLLLLRRNLIAEEARELDLELERAIIEVESGGPVSGKVRSALMKEMADLLYVLIGTAVTFKLPMLEIFGRVHESNMSKLGSDGRPVLRPDGEPVKGPDYREPFLEDL